MFAEFVTLTECFDCSVTSRAPSPSPWRWSPPTWTRRPRRSPSPPPSTPSRCSGCPGEDLMSLDWNQQFLIHSLQSIFSHGEACYFCIESYFFKIVCIIFHWNAAVHWYDNHCDMRTPAPVGVHSLLLCYIVLPLLTLQWLYCQSALFCFIKYHTVIGRVGESLHSTSSNQHLLPSVM